MDVPVLRARPQPRGSIIRLSNSRPDGRTTKQAAALPTTHATILPPPRSSPAPIRLMPGVASPERTTVGAAKPEPSTLGSPAPARAGLGAYLGTRSARCGPRGGLRSTWPQAETARLQAAASMSRPLPRHPPNVTGCAPHGHRRPGRAPSLVSRHRKGETNRWWSETDRGIESSVLYIRTGCRHSHSPQFLCDRACASRSFKGGEVRPRPTLTFFSVLPRGWYRRSANISKLKTICLSDALKKGIAL